MNKFKKPVSLLLTLLLLLSIAAVAPISVSAITDSTYGNNYNIDFEVISEEEKTARITDVTIRNYVDMDVVIPETVTNPYYNNGQSYTVTEISDFGSDSYYRNGSLRSYIKSVSIPKTVESIPFHLNNNEDTYKNPFVGLNVLEEIIVDEDNRNYCSVDGVLYDKAKTICFICPEKKSGYHIIPNTVTEIKMRAFLSPDAPANARPRKGA